MSHTLHGRRIVSLEVPEAWFADPEDGDRHRRFYSSLLAALAEMKVLVDPIWMPRGAESAPRRDGRGRLIISFHSHGAAADNILRCKESYIPPYYGMDTMGYACFSHLSHHFEDYSPAIERQDAVRATRFRQELARELRQGNLSKYTQPSYTETEQAGYVFVPLQLRKDSVVKGAWLDSHEALRTTIAAASAQGLKTIVKRHPRCRDSKTSQLLNEVIRNSDVTASEASVHALIVNAALVVGANSGVLFEALIQGKPVVTHAASDFGPATQQVRSHDELAHAIAIPNPPNDAWRDRFLFWYLTEYCVRADDVPAIRRKIAQALATCAFREGIKDVSPPRYARRLYAYSVLNRIKRRFF